MHPPLALLSCILLSLSWHAAVGAAMGSARLAELRNLTVDVFQHGFNNYMQHAFPEDEVRYHVFPFPPFPPVYLRLS